MAPINLPDGTEVSEVILPDGSTASEVIAPDGRTGFGAIPDSVVNRLPLNEGSGTFVEASVGSADGTLNNGGTWVDDSAYPNGTAPAFNDADNDYATWTPRSTTPITWTVGVDVGSMSSGDNYIWGQNVAPLLSYNANNDNWRLVSEGGKEQTTVSESQSTVEGSIRFLAARLDASDLKLDVYQSDATTKVGSSSASSPNTAFDGSTNYFGDREQGGGDGWDGQILGPFDVHDSTPSDSEIDNIIGSVYG